MSDDNRSQQATLGCGTLILIALIVMIFSGGGTKDLEREVKDLKTEVGALKKAVESQTDEIHALGEKVGKGKE
jgi:Sec-independent protein translocase protein TatA